jgi:hypothetical protein
MADEPTPDHLPTGLIPIGDNVYVIDGEDITLDSHSIDLAALNIARIELLNGAHLTVNPAGLDLNALSNVTYGIGNNSKLTLAAAPVSVNLGNSTTIDFAQSGGTGLFEYEPGKAGINVVSPIKIVNLNEGDRIRVEGTTSAELTGNTLLFKTGKTAQSQPPQKPGPFPKLTKGITTVVKDATGAVGKVLGGDAKFTIDPDAKFDFARVENDGQITIKVPCFLAGTLISTPAGEFPVERLKRGAPVYTMNGDAVPIRWIGRRRIDPKAVDRLREFAPIRIRPGALDHGAPNRDLYLSPDHCLFHNGSFIPAKLLVNGTSITQEATLEPFTYYHVELEQHGVLIAEGAYAESYLDLGNRVSFLEPGTLMFTAPAGSKKPTSCYPPIYSGPILDGIRETLAQRAIELGYHSENTALSGGKSSNVFPFIQ